MYDVTYDFGICFADRETKEVFQLTENEFFEIWDDIRRRSVFIREDVNPAKIMIYDLLFSLGYLSKIRILDNKTNTMKDGYQINEGSGRIYALKGT